MRWGLVPLLWSKPLNELPATFNARAETVAEKPMFRSAFKARRCIIPASGFYEWTAAKGAKTPHYFSAPDGRALAFAGLWERAPNPETKEMMDSATIIVARNSLAWARRLAAAPAGSFWHMTSTVSGWSIRGRMITTQSIAGGDPILVLDMFEHVYQMDFGAKAADYVKTVMAAINWTNADRLYDKYGKG